MFLKYYLWARKIEEMIDHLESQGKKRNLYVYLKVCVFLRSIFLKKPYTETENYFTLKIKPYLCL
jgi:hypothetical protein